MFYELLLGVGEDMGRHSEWKWWNIKQQRGRVSREHYLYWSGPFCIGQQVGPLPVKTSSTAWSACTLNASNYEIQAVMVLSSLSNLLFLLFMFLCRDWSDWTEDSPSAVCLFCEEAMPLVSDLLQHMKVSSKPERNYVRHVFCPNMLQLQVTITSTLTTRRQLLLYWSHLYISLDSSGFRRLFVFSQIHLWKWKH